MGIIRVLFLFFLSYSCISLLLLSHAYTIICFIFSDFFFFFIHFVFSNYSSWFMSVFCVCAASSKLAVLSFGFFFERVKEHTIEGKRGRWKTAINIRNLFKFNFDFICFLSVAVAVAAAVVFTFIRFGSVRFALSHPKIPSIRPSWQPVCPILPISRGRADWLTDCPLTTIIVIIGPG